jgi:hypothetical protein
VTLPSTGGQLPGVLPMPAQYVVIDIETGHAPPEVIDQAIRWWKPPGNIKDPTKIEARRKEATAKLAENSALLDGSPILCVAAATDQYAVVWNGMDKRRYKLDATPIQSHGDEKEMLLAFAKWLDAVAGPDTVLVGFNLKRFDLPRLRVAYLRHGLKLPECLRTDQLELPLIFDVMSRFLRFFTAERSGDLFISLGEVLDRLGLPQPKEIVCGAEVPTMHEAGQVKEILTYSLVDVLSTRAAFGLLNA